MAEGDEGGGGVVALEGLDTCGRAVSAERFEARSAMVTEKRANMVPSLRGYQLRDL